MLGEVEEIRVPLGEGGAVAATVPGRGAGPVVARGPGAGGSRKTPQLVSVAQALAAGGRSAVLFNFPYTDARRKAPDPPARLEATVAAVARHCREALGATRLVLGGRSMGGRIASQAVAKGLAEADGLVFLAYPLHPPGRTDVLRDAHLPGIGAPMLFVQGTRDAFAREDLLRGTLERLGPRASFHEVPEGDHSFAVPRRLGRAPGEVLAGIMAAIERWLEAHGL